MRQFIGPEMTREDIAQLRIRQDRTRDKYLTGPYCLSQGDGFCSAKGWYDGQFWLGADDEIHPLIPASSPEESQ